MSAIAALRPHASESQRRQDRGQRENQNDERSSDFFCQTCVGEKRRVSAEARSIHQSIRTAVVLTRPQHLLDHRPEGMLRGEHTGTDQCHDDRSRAERQQTRAILDGHPYDQCESDDRGGRRDPGRGCRAGSCENDDRPRRITRQESDRKHRERGAVPAMIRQRDDRMEVSKTTKRNPNQTAATTLARRAISHTIQPAE